MQSQNFWKKVNYGKFLHITQTHPLRRLNDERNPLE